MQLFNLVDFETWNADILTKNEIRINSSVNDYGSILYDYNGNRISNTVVGCGRQDIIEMTSNTNGNIILYSDNADYFKYISVSSFDDSENDKYFLLDMQDVNRYKINAEKLISTSVANNKITVDLTGKGIFKVLLNGDKIENFTYDNSGITIGSEDVGYISEYNNKAIIYCYDINQTVSGETIFKYYSSINFYNDSTGDYDNEAFFHNYEINYENLSGSFTVGGILTGSVSGAYGEIVSDTGSKLKIKNCSNENFVVGEEITDDQTVVTADVLGFIDRSMQEICLFDEYAVNHSRVLWNRDRAYKYNEKQRSVNREILIPITNKSEIRDIVGLNYFRFLGWSKTKKQLHIFNNCLIQEGANISYVKLNPNTYTYNIKCEDYIILDYNTQTVYGTSPYGQTQFGGNLFKNYTQLEGI